MKDWLSKIIRRLSSLFFNTELPVKVARLVTLDHFGDHTSEDIIVCKIYCLHFVIVSLSLSNLEEK